MENFAITNAYRYLSENYFTELGIKWDRPNPGPFIWGLIEKKKGSYDWSQTDEYIKNDQKMGLNLLVIIYPFAKWDQKVKSGADEREFERDNDGKILFGYGREKPRDMDSYIDFVKALVERYNCDGINDMPGLRYPVKYWEVSNEPSFQQHPKVFFEGSPEDYYDLLKSTYEAIKSVDKSAKVLNGGMAHMMRNASPRGKIGTVEFWERVLSLGGGKYFDIGNIHSINASNDFFVPDYSNFLKEHGIEKEIWVTEAHLRIEGLDINDVNALEAHAAAIVKGYVKAFANGAVKVFYTHLSATKDSREAFMRCTLILEGEKLPAYYALKTMIKKIEGFIKVEKIFEGFYRFEHESKKTYVLWDEGLDFKGYLPNKVKVTNIYGSIQEMNVNDIKLKATPIFIELIN